MSAALAMFFMPNANLFQSLSPYAYSGTSPITQEDVNDSFSDRPYEWYVANFPYRLNDKKTGAIVHVTQRLHDDDLVGRELRSGCCWCL